MSTVLPLKSNMVAAPPEAVAERNARECTGRRRRCRRAGGTGLWFSGRWFGSAGGDEAEHGVRAGCRAVRRSSLTSPSGVVNRMVSTPSSTLDARLASARRLGRRRRAPTVVVDLGEDTVDDGEHAAARRRLAGSRRTGPIRRARTTSWRPRSTAVTPVVHVELRRRAAQLLVAGPQHHASRRRSSRALPVATTRGVPVAPSRATMRSASLHDDLPVVGDAERPGTGRQWCRPGDGAVEPMGLETADRLTVER